MEEQPLQIDGALAGGPTKFLTVGEAAQARRIAYLRRVSHGDGAALPGIVWLGGFNSNMRGEKASHLDCAAAANGRAYLRLRLFRSMANRKVDLRRARSAYGLKKLLPGSGR